MKPLLFCVSSSGSCGADYALRAPIISGMANLPATHHPFRITADHPSARHMLIRTAAPADAASVLACAREMFSTSDYTLTSKDEFSVTLEQELALLTTVHEHPRQAFFIAIDEAACDEHGPLVIGLMSMFQNTAKRKLRHTVNLGMGIRTAYRGRGVGDALMSRGMEWARQHPDLAVVTLEVYAANTPGLALYRRHGFQTHGTLCGGLTHDDGSEWDQILMHCRVDGSRG